MRFEERKRKETKVRGKEKVYTIQVKERRVLSRRIQ